MIITHFATHGERCLLSDYASEMTGLQLLVLRGLIAACRGQGHALTNLRAAEDAMGLRTLEHEL